MLYICTIYKSQVQIWDFSNYNEIYICFVVTLEDSHIWNLSQRITSGQDLRELGTRVLGFEKHIIYTALYNHRTSIQDAAYNVLSIWREHYQSSQVAYINLQAGLKRAQMNQLAAELQSWVEGISPESHHITLPKSQHYEESEFILKFGHLSIYTITGWLYM